MSKFADHVHISINAFSKRVIHSDLRLEQKMREHHQFSFMWHYTGSTVIKPEEQFSQIQKFNGSEVIFTFTSPGGTKLMSKGIIQRTITKYSNGSPIGLQVIGSSHTAVLNDVKKSRIFKNQTFGEIALDVFFKEGPGDFYQKEAIKPTYTKRFDAIAQYKETNFDFLRRLATRYGQWFYFDGMRMQLGQLKYSKIKLVNGSSLHNFGIETVLESHKSSLSGYDYNSASMIRSYLEKTATGSDDSLSRVIHRDQRQIAHPELVNYGSYTSQASNKGELEEMVKLQTAGNDAGSVFYTGTSYLPIGLGHVFSINDQGVPRDVVAIEIIHLSTGIGNYTCDFVAIPVAVTAPHYTNVEKFAKADVQPAKISDNKDETGLGRVIVRFNWHGPEDKTQSDWIRIIQPHSGAGKGFYWIPEIGEEVLVGFEDGDIDRPFVMGAQYNGTATSGYYTPGNDKKVLQTKSGCKVLINDADGSILTEDAAGSIVFQDGKGNVDVDAPKNITLTAGENINFNAGQNMNTTVGLNKTNTVGANYTENITGSKLVTIGFNFMTKVVGNLAEFIKGKRESESTERKEIAKSVVLHSIEDSINVHASKFLNKFSGEGTINS